jgi:hypothetical protein
MIRNELFTVLEELSRRYPDWRIGQLLANVADWADQNVWEVEDQQLLDAARSHLEVSQSGTVRS